MAVEGLAARWAWSSVYDIAEKLFNCLSLCFDIGFFRRINMFF
jgi:hypothetical protein